MAPLFLACVLALPVLSSVADEGDDQYHFIVGLAEKGLHELVVKEATRFLQDHADHEKVDLARYRLASALFDLGRSTDARPHFATLTQVRGFRFADEVAFRHGQCELEVGEHDAAAAAFERVRQGSEEYLKTPATFLLGEAHFRAERYRDAALYYAETLEAEDAGEHASDAVHGLAWCAFRVEDYDLAVARAADFLSRWPGDARALELRFLSGESHLEAGRAEAALAEYERVTGGAFHAAALRGAGFACALLGDHARAAQSFGTLLESYPKSRYTGEAALHRGIHLLKLGDPRGAYVVLSSGKAGDGAEVLYWRGRALANLERYKEALAAFDLALTRQPEQELARRVNVARGDVLYDMGETDRAAAAYKSAGSDYAVHAAAVARLNDGFAQEAIDLAIQLVDPKRKSPYRLEATLTLGEAYFAQKNYEEAKEAFLVVVREEASAERKARATTRIGWCDYLSGDMAAARKRFRAVTNTWPDSPEAAEARFMQGRAAEEQNDTGSAATAYRRYLSDHPGGQYRQEATVRLARFEDGGDAERRLTEFLRGSSSSEFAAQAHFDLAERLAGREEWAAAQQHYAAVVQEHPDHALAPSAGYGLAWCLYSQERYEPALTQLETLAAREGVEDELMTAALELAVWSGRRAGEVERTKLAWAAFATRCEDEPRRLKAARVVVTALEEAGRIPEAEKLYGDLLARTSDRGVAVGICVESAYLALDRGDVGTAEKQVRAAHRYSPDDPDLAECFFFVGEAHFEAGEDQAASAAYSVASDSPDPEVASRALYKGGFAHMRQDEPDQAIRFFGRVVNEHPDSALYGESLFLLGEAHFRAGRYSQAIGWLDRVRQEVPRHEAMSKALYRLGVAQTRTELWRDGAETLANLAKRFPDFPHLVEAELWRGRALVGLDQRRSARTAFERVTQSDRGVLAAQAHIEMGRLALAEGDLDESLSKFLYVAVLYAHPEEVAEALFMAGQVLEAKGDRDKAKERYREAIAQHPEARFTRRARERLKALGD